MRLHLLPVLLTLLVASVRAEPALLSNGSFEKGIAAPDNWTPSEGAAARWEKFGRSGKRCISVSTTPADGSVFWRCDVALTAGQAYRFSFWSKAEKSGSGCIISGPDTFNCDFPFSAQWTRQEFIFVAGRSQSSYLRLGQWNANGRVFFDDVALIPLQPLHQRQATGNQSTLELGAGESIEGGHYRFQPAFAQGNASRPLHESTAGFNSTRWLFNDSSAVVYRHAIGHELSAARITASINYHVAGTLLVEASRDGQAWQKIGEKSATGTLDASIPASLLPAKVLWVRLRGLTPAKAGGDSHPGNFQVNDYSFEATLPAAFKSRAARGETVYLVKEAGSLDAQVLSLGDLRPGGKNLALLAVNLPSTLKNAPIVARLSFSNGGAKPISFERRLAGKQSLRLSVPYELRSAGDHRLLISLSTQNNLLYRAATSFNVPSLAAADYGYRIGTSRDTLSDVWWSESGYKIGRSRPLPATLKANLKSAIDVRAARNEYEPFQIVARPSRAVADVRVSVSDLSGPNGARIGSKYFDVCEVDYVHVTQPTDRAGSSGWWPDPLPPHRKPINLKAGQNQPFWITLHVPKTTRAGFYRGNVTMSGSGWKRVVPLRLQVWNFALSDETHVQSGFGMNTNFIKKFHNLETPAEVSAVTKKYLENFAAHRISPYNPMHDAPIEVDFGQASRWQGGTFDATQPAQGARSLKIEDSDRKVSVSAIYGRQLPVVAGQKYFVAWSIRTAQADQAYFVSLSTHDAEGQQISGNNLDLRFTGQREWKRERAEVSAHITSHVRFVQFHLRPAPWTEQGEKIATAWFDDVQLIGPDGANLLQGGDFEVGAQPVKIDWTKFDAAAERAFKTHHFTAWMLRLQGVGSGTYAERSKGRIGPFEEGSPEYETMFRSYLEQLQAHLEKKGWLDRAYVYWFDEPDPKDYQFVADGMARIHKYAPKLRRLLTEQPEPAMFGAVNLWCPLLNEFNPDIATQRRRAGEDFWWYICTGPKAPYVTEFIDHPGAVLRTWLWQTWKYNVSGILIWESLYWSSDAAYPNTLQNPWRDPMSWVSGYGETNSRTPWGNGDGRFLYPPNRNVESDRSKYFDGPINSLRWEMLREGIEDYEYFWLLRERTKAAKKRGVDVRAAERLLQVPLSVTKDLTTFSHSPLPMLAHRNRIAQAIEKLAATSKGK